MYGFQTEYSSNDTRLQPLARIDIQEERTWAMEWLSALLGNFGFVLTPAKRNAIWDGLCILAGVSKQNRYPFSYVAA